MYFITLENQQNNQFTEHKMTDEQHEQFMLIYNRFQSGDESLLLDDRTNLLNIINDTLQNRDEDEEYDHVNVTIMCCDNREDVVQNILDHVVDYDEHSMEYFLKYMMKRLSDDQLIEIRSDLINCVLE